MDEIAVLIPCYNEEKTIAKVCRDFAAALPAASIYVYDNNSTDRSIEEARGAGAIVRRERMQGKGRVLRRMFREIDARCYITVDGDDTYPAEAAAKMASLVIDHNVDMVIGDRLSSTYFSENKRAFHSAGNVLVLKAINLLFKSGIRDIMTGYRALSYRFVKTVPVLSAGFEIETEMTIHAIDKHLEIENLVIDYRDRPEGSMSKLNTYSDGTKVLFTIARLYATYHPGVFFGAFGAVLALIAAILFAPILVTYFETGLVPRIPTLIVCGFMALTAIISVFSGLILQTILHKNRQDFEIALIRADEAGRKLFT